MYRITTFQALLKGLPRGEFDQLVKRREADKYCKRFRHWDHLIAMMYAQLSGAPSLRAIEAGFNSHLAHHYHLNTSAIKRSTLADANEKRSDAVFSAITQALMLKVSRRTRQDSKELMCLLDSTSITLKGRDFDMWTLEDRTRNTQGIKLHVLYDAKNDIPVWHDFSAANVNDIDKGREIPIEPGALYVFDKGYNDYNWWHAINMQKALFVTRFKRNAGVRIERKFDIPEDAVGTVLADEVVRFKHRRPGGKRINEAFDHPLRRVTIDRPDKGTPIVLATNDFTSTALEIAQHYKKRWDIELFFKWVKQHLKIKQFFGRSENAVRIQILTALISYLLVALHRNATGSKKSLWEHFCKVRATLFQRSALEELAHRRRQEAKLAAENQLCLI